MSATSILVGLVLLAPFSGASLSAPLIRSRTQLPLNPTSDDWNQLRQAVGGRLYRSVPLATPCFNTTSFNASQCQIIETNYLNDTFRTDNFGAYIETQWETCQATGQQCLLDFSDPANAAATSLPFTCQIGSIPNNYIDLRKPQDVSAAFQFSKVHGVPLVVKNTGHDYKGRSSAPGSLGLWTHNLKNLSYSPSFVPQGCSGKSHSAVTLGAGVQWSEAYAFAALNNVELIGGSDVDVGAAGGWLQGGGHGFLSNTLGLGVDRALEFKVVTPDGKYRIVNACQNEDLFFALRGGGAGTFGVVLEATVLASPQQDLQLVAVLFSEDNSTLTGNLWSLVIDNSLTWAKDGWGALINGQSAIYVNPTLSPSAANASMKPLIDFGNELVEKKVNGAQVIVATLPSSDALFKLFADSSVSAAVGVNLALTSRLIPTKNLETSESREELLSALLEAQKLSSTLRILVTTPFNHPGDGHSSVTPAWYSSIFHVTLITTWNFNATRTEKESQYNLASQSIDFLRKITPDAAYVNEADVHEPNHEYTFWGNNYARLLQIKKKYDPDHLLDCWQCVGWNPGSSRFSCYL